MISGGEFVMPGGSVVVSGGPVLVFICSVMIL